MSSGYYSPSEGAFASASVMYFVDFILAYTLTIGIEIPLLYLVTRKQAEASLILVTGVVMNACTLPIVWFVLPLCLQGAAYVLTSEIFAVVVECFIIRYILRVDLRTAFLGSFLANLGSFLFGLLIFGLPS